MDEFTQGMLIALIPALIVAIVSPIITIKLSVKQFYSQRWWEKKAEAYSNVIEQLSYLQLCYEEWLDDWIHIKKLEDEDKKRLKEGYRRAKEIITKAAATGAYLVSDKTADTLARALHDLEKGLSPGTDFFEELEKRHILVKDCIAQIKEYAKTDLR